MHASVVTLTAAACLVPTLLAYSQTPASTLYNQLLAWLSWGVVLLVAGRAQHRLNRKLLTATLCSVRQRLTPPCAWVSLAANWRPWVCWPEPWRSPPWPMPSDMGGRQE